jgi:diaminohydroxyphosphoribosylaminopyrimidine deaminase/5-amino-6-(5-phosphoribosylamino)uracil reductase
LILHETYICRCLQLAQLACGYVAPNPMVGSVLVHQGRIIGEGYHRAVGLAHAEVNCFNSVKQADAQLISQAILYVSLEPCAHFGKTPPCADLIIQKKVPKVIVGCRDPFSHVNGKGIEKLRASGIEVVEGVLQDECEELNKRFFCFQNKKRPFIILKWAQTADGKIAALLPNPIIKNTGGLSARLLISNEFTNRQVHKWRSEEMAILVGTNTALQDNPELTTRFVPGKHPLRLVIDLNLKLSAHLNVFNSDARTIIFNNLQHKEIDNIIYFKLKQDINVIQQILNVLYSMNVQSLLVEGGAQTLQSFIDEKLWDEARIITNQELIIANGLAAPILPVSKLVDSENWLTDRINYYVPV